LSVWFSIEFDSSSADYFWKILVMFMLVRQQL